MIYPVFFHRSDWLAWMRSTKLAEEILRGCEKISRCPATVSGRAAKYLKFHCGTPLVVSMSNQERIFSQRLR